MSENRYVALLRGINVGGNNLIKMIELRSSFAEMGFSDVETYIQSGNVIFSSNLKNKVKLTAMIEEALSEAFNYESKVVVVSGSEMERVVAQAPKGFGKDPVAYRYDVIFVKEPVKTSEALKDVPTAPGIDTVAAGDHALYFRRLVSEAAKSKLSKLVQRPVYKNLTIRNWNTTMKLFQMVQK
ncbi:MAG TPA: DUF1697 domain-containing protein [Pyrinomonadaceae bacterium]|nr:DUF1697 domain-containing protein [Pyrinomonadaceae bacterium]